MSDALVHRDDDDRIAVLTLDSPANRNALSRRLVAELTAHLAEAGADESLHGVLLRSSHPVFCAGADLKEAATVDMVEAARDHHRPAARHRRPAGTGRLPARRPGARRWPGPGRLRRRRGLPRRRDLRPHRGAPRPRGRRHLDPAAGPAQPARGIRLVPHRPLGGCRPRPASRAWSPSVVPADEVDAARAAGARRPAGRCPAGPGRGQAAAQHRPRRGVRRARRRDGAPVAGCCSTPRSRRSGWPRRCAADRAGTARRPPGIRRRSRSGEVPDVP